MACWELHHQQATLRTPELTGDIDLVNPGSGVNHVHYRGQGIPGTFLGLSALTDGIGREETIADCYVRGRDLVATYVERPDRPLRPQIYWRPVSAEPNGDQGAPAGLEMIVSLQTNRLDRRPDLSTCTTVDADEALVPADRSLAVLVALDTSRLHSPEQGLVLLRLPGKAISYAAMVHPSDFRGGEIDVLRGKEVRLSFGLFGEHLEKGVIRRVRLRGLFLPRERDEELALAAFQAFADERLPLTT